jgi:hypothetical protein
MLSLKCIGRWYTFVYVLSQLRICNALLSFLHGSMLSLVPFRLQLHVESSISIFSQGFRGILPPTNGAAVLKCRGHGGGSWASWLL